MQCQGKVGYHLIFPYKLKFGPGQIGEFLLESWNFQGLCSKGDAKFAWHAEELEVLLGAAWWWWRSSDHAFPWAQMRRPAIVAATGILCRCSWKSVFLTTLCCKNGCSFPIHGGTPKSSKSLDYLMIETYGDLGIPLSGTMIGRLAFKNQLHLAIGP